MNGISSLFSKTLLKCASKNDWLLCISSNTDNKENTLIQRILLEMPIRSQIEQLCYRKLHSGNEFGIIITKLIMWIILKTACMFYQIASAKLVKTHIIYMDNP